MSFLSSVKNFGAGISKRISLSPALSVLDTISSYGIVSAKYYHETDHVYHSITGMVADMGDFISEIHFLCPYDTGINIVVLSRNKGGSFSLATLENSDASDASMRLKSFKEYIESKAAGDHFPFFAKDAPGKGTLVRAAGGDGFVSINTYVLTTIKNSK